MDYAALAKVLHEIMPDSVSEVERYLTCFSCFYHLKNIIEKKGWKYPHAAYANNLAALSRLYDVAFKYDRSLDSGIDRVYKLFSDLPVTDFLRSYVDWPQAVRTADQIKLYSKHITDDALCMTLVLLFREMSGEENKQPYVSTYKDNFLKEQWEDMLLFASPDITPLIYKSKVHASSREALKLMKKAGFKMQEQLQIFQMIREEIVGSYHYRRKNAWKHKADYPWRYLQKLHREYPRLDLLGLNEWMDSAADSIAKIKIPTDYLTAMYDLYQLDDSDLEHDFILPAFVAELSAGDTILVVNPAPDFLKCYPNEWTSSTTFCVQFEELAAILREEFPTVAFITFEELKSHADSSSSIKFSKSLAFLRGTASDLWEQWFENIHKSMKEDGRLYALLPSECVIASSRSTPYLFDGYSIETIDIVLSALSSRSKPVNKAFVSACVQCSGKDITIRKYELLSGGVNRPSFLKMKGTAACPAESLCTDMSLNKLFAHLERRPSEVIRSEPDTFRFTPEIIFWFKKSMTRTGKLKAEAYVSDYADRKQMRRTSLGRGKRIKEGYCSTITESESELDEWLTEKLPYSGRIHDSAVRAYENAKKCGVEKYPLLQNGICLATLWYLYLDIPRDKKKYQPPREELEFFRFQDIALLRVADLDGEDGPAILDDKMRAFQAATGHEELLPYWARLGHLLAAALRNGEIRKNPVEQILEREKKQQSKKDIAELKNALAKRSFRTDEESLLLKMLHLDTGDNAEHLAVVIRFFTGIEANIVSALTWGDIYHIPVVGIDQFRIYRQFDNITAKIHPFDSPSSYRRIPIAPTLKAALDARRNYLIKTLHIEKIHDLQIVAPDPYVIDDAKPQIVPRTINKWSQKAVQRIGVEDNCITTSDEKGVIETNLSDYHGDIFRSNFKYRANYTCGFTEAEACYVLGLRQSSPFGKNYCDFTNDLAQFVIYQKLCRWEAMLAETPAIPSKHIRSISSIADIGGAELRVEMEAGKSVELTVSCPSAFSGEVLLFGEEGRSYGKQEL